MALRIDDTLEHHGVPGMKWGKRAAKAYGQGFVNRSIRPIKNLKGTVREKIKHPASLVVVTPKAQRRINADVASQVQKSKISKAAAKVNKATNERSNIKNAFDKKVENRKKKQAAVLAKYK